MRTVRSFEYALYKRDFGLRVLDRVDVAGQRKIAVGIVELDYFKLRPRHDKSTQASGERYLVVARAVDFGNARHGRFFAVGHRDRVRSELGRVLLRNNSDFFHTVCVCSERRDYAERALRAKMWCKTIDFISDLL